MDQILHAQYLVYQPPVIYLKRIDSKATDVEAVVQLLN